jgi:hypothetical protein
MTSPAQPVGAELVPRRAPAGRLPDFLVIGAPRSGTTALTHYLRAHGDVFIPDRKECNFFNRPDVSGARRRWYEQQFAPARATQVVGEATPTYLFAPGATARIAQLVPDARLVALLREPAGRAYSHYWLCRLLGVERRTFAQAVADELAGHAPPGCEYLAYGDYLTQLERALEHFPSSALLVLLFDDLGAAPAELYAACCRHIGVDATQRPAVVGERINTPQRQRSVRLWRALERWRLSGRRGFRVASALAALNSRPFDPPPVDHDVHRALVDHFADRTTALGAWLGRDLTNWMVTR